MEPALRQRQENRLAEHRQAAEAAEAMEKAAQAVDAAVEESVRRW